ncbi:MAG: hypothetical protein HRT88_18085, partial [Lentisphaeraceae bacterium]|nr:hypothetical protein [Lentisphaeraceae bacterium]
MKPSRKDNSKKREDLLLSLYDETFELAEKKHNQPPEERYEILEVVDEGTSKKILKVKDRVTK